MKCDVSAGRHMPHGSEMSNVQMHAVVRPSLYHDHQHIASPSFIHSHIASQSHIPHQRGVDDLHGGSLLDLHRNTHSLQCNLCKSAASSNVCQTCAPPCSWTADHTTRVSGRGTVQIRTSRASHRCSNGAARLCFGATAHERSISGHGIMTVHVLQLCRFIEYHSLTRPTDAVIANMRERRISVYEA